MSDFDQVSENGKGEFSLVGTKVKNAKSASTMDWTTEDSDDDTKKAITKENIALEKADESDDDDSSSEDESDDESDHGDMMVSVVVEKPEERAKTPITKKDKKLQREMELKELEMALSEFGLATDEPKAIPKAVSVDAEPTNESSKAADGKKKKKKKPSSSVKDAEASEPAATQVAEPVIEGSIDPKEILLHRAKKAKKTSVSEAAKAAAAEIKSRSESDKKKKKDKSKRGYSETSY